MSKAVWITGLIIILLLLTSFVLLYTNTFSIVQNIQAMAQKAITDTAATNAYEVYRGVREGNTANVKFSGSVWTKTNLTKDVISQMRTLLRLNHLNGTYSQVDSNGQIQYSLTNVTVELNEVNKNDNNDVSLSFMMKLRLQIPLRYSADKPPIIISLPMTIKSSYTPLY